MINLNGINITAGYGGVDIIWIETMSSIEEAKAAILSAKEVNLPVVCTMSFDSFGKTMMGVTPREFQNLAYDIELDAYGLNCGIGPAESIDTVLNFEIKDKNKVPFVTKISLGFPENGS